MFDMHLFFTIQIKEVTMFFKCKELYRKKNTIKKKKLVTSLLTFKIIWT